MPQELQHDNSIRVTEFNLIDFTFAVAELGSKGFVPTLLNGSHPEGGFGSYYTCTMVARNAYRIDAQGNHLNVPNTSQETAIKDDSSDVSAVGGTDVAETANAVKTAVKRTTTKKTT